MSDYLSNLDEALAAALRRREAWSRIATDECRHLVIVTDERDETKGSCHECEKPIDLSEFLDG